MRLLYSRNESRTIMNESERWTVRCQDAGDGSGDVIVDLPPELLAKLGLEVGDDLTITKTKDAIVLRPTRSTASLFTAFAGALRDDAYQAYRIRLEASLHIPLDASDQDIHEIIEAGFPANLISALGESGTISAEERDRIIPLKTLKSKLASNQRLTLSESDRLFRVAHINAMAEVVFGDAGKSKHWLSTPKARFSGSSPYAMLSTTQGTHRVEEMLIQATEGMSF
ncbi:antitoxin Xre/MbcA/ParS toxin-binding domain-containing protein [Pseudomonas sp. 14A]|uniref:antitoxin Xre/MbcA/ParS toxin-binding domain-containing protein n=1 Tax=Pseudomonas sp. 14A TaxID=2823142 RepID=UPI001B82D917|nr:antitoxin Xre/MbcA/ParS toxin-binding domain-containing protein [Pseudomonas sp. 14A]MBR7200319.1 DUF2384 domain-containing protein [Pseudomonas sp. 14A]